MIEQEAKQQQFKALKGDVDRRDASLTK